MTVVVPVWNRADLLRNLLKTISAQTLAPQQVLVIDNGSTDDAVEVARDWGATVIAMGSNRGFAAAVNQGIAASRTDWIAVVNSDVELHPDWLKKLVVQSIEQRAWLACGKILMRSGPARIDGAFDLVARSGCPWRAGNGRLDSEEFATGRRVHLIPATAALYRRDLFDRIGNFAQIYESYLEDVDLSLRAAAAGFEAIYVPQAVCLHHGSASSSAWSVQMVYLLSRNQELLIRRLFPPGWRYRIRVGRLLWGLLAMRHRRLGAWLRGKRDALGIRVEHVQLDADALRSIIIESEAEIFKIQSKSSMDIYWRLYFLFTGTGAK